MLDDLRLATRWSGQAVADTDEFFWSPGTEIARTPRRRRR
jgi:hypothetical protein